MTVIEPSALRALQPVSFDLYRDIHKGIRVELFAVVTDAGRLDPTDVVGAASLSEQVRRTLQLLGEHAEHEDGAIQPVLELHDPALADRVAADHHELEARMQSLGNLAAEIASVTSRRAPLHELYVELAAFTGSYLLHQDLEERLVGQALESAIGVDGVIDIHMAIVGGMPPQQLISGLAVMFPAMNVDDRTELLGGMRATAPAEAFDAVWSLAKSVLPSEDARALTVRLGLA